MFHGLYTNYWIIFSFEVGRRNTPTIVKRAGGTTLPVSLITILLDDFPVSYGLQISFFYCHILSALVALVRQAGTPYN